MMSAPTDRAAQATGEQQWRQSSPTSMKEQRELTEPGCAWTVVWCRHVHAPLLLP